MVGKACARCHVEVVEHEERAEVAELWCANRSSDFGACSLGRLNGEEDLANCARDAHVGRWNGKLFCFDLRVCRAVGVVGLDGFIQDGVGRSSDCLCDVRSKDENGYDSDKDGYQDGEERNELLHQGRRIVAMLL